MDFKPDKFVVGENIRPTRGFMLGRNPGRLENQLGHCFVGPAGNELSMFALRSGLQRQDFALSNLHKFFTVDDEPPTDEQFDDHWPVFCRELAITKSQILVTFGGQVTAYMFRKCGIDFRGMTCHRGIPVKAHLDINADLQRDIEKWPPEDLAGIEYYNWLFENAPAEYGPIDIVIHPATHPAAGLHASSKMADIHQDFVALAELMSGALKPRDPNVSTVYTNKFILNTAKGVEGVFASSNSKIMGLDTEGTAQKPHCLTFSLDHGIGYFIAARDKEAIAAFKRCMLTFITNGGILVIHNVLWDLDVMRAMDIELPDGSYLDSMMMAYLLGREPQGLKPLAYRHENVKMSSYEDLVRPYAFANGLKYLEAAASLDFDSCPKCGAYRAKGTLHPRGGFSEVPADWITKDGKRVRKKMAEFVEMCDDRREDVELVMNKAGRVQEKRVIPISKRIDRALADFRKIDPNSFVEETEE